mgnify:CR=1 FL=1
MDDSLEIPAVQRIVSRQLNKWAIEARAADERREFGHEHARAVPPWVTISREPGSGARELAEILSKRLGYDVYGRELLERMAEGGPIARAAFERVESGPHDSLREAVFLSLDRAYPGHYTYLKRLVAIATALAARGNVILIGRGLHFVLPREHGLCLRLVASLERRIENVARQRNCSAREAELWIEQADRSQNELVRHILHRDLRDVHAYDMVLDTETLGIDTCANLVETALRTIPRTMVVEA